MEPYFLLLLSLTLWFRDDLFVHMYMHMYALVTSTLFLHHPLQLSTHSVQALLGVGHSEWQ